MKSPFDESTMLEICEEAERFIDGYDLSDIE